MIPKDGWKPMTSAPRDGTVIMVLYREFNAKEGKAAIQPAQWLCDLQGSNWCWRKPWSQATTAHADQWMTYQEFQARADKPAASTEFDL